MDEKNSVRKQRRRLDLLGSVLSLGGLGLTSGGLYLLLPAAGVIFLGLGTMVLGLMICRKAGGMSNDR